MTSPGPSVSSSSRPDCSLTRFRVRGPRCSTLTLWALSSLLSQSSASCALSLHTTNVSWTAPSKPAYGFVNVLASSMTNRGVGASPMCLGLMMPFKSTALTFLDGTRRGFGWDGVASKRRGGVGARASALRGSHFVGVRSNLSKAGRLLSRLDIVVVAALLVAALRPFAGSSAVLLPALFLSTVGHGLRR